MLDDKANPDAFAGDQDERDQRREPTLDGGAPVLRKRKALVAPDRDAEQVAFQLWREGRKDDAIAFLEREILLEKDFAWKHDATRREPHFDDAEPQVIVPPPSDAATPKRRRRLGEAPVIAVSEPAFSDASAPLIELKAEPVAGKRGPDGPHAAGGATTPPPEMIAALQGQRMGRGPAWIAGIGLLVVCLSAVANVWDEGGNAAPEVAAVATDIAEPAEPADATPAASSPEAATEPATLADALAAAAADAEPADTSVAGTSSEEAPVDEAMADKALADEAMIDEAGDETPAFDTFTDHLAATRDEDTGVEATEPKATGLAALAEKAAAASESDAAAFDDIAPPPDGSELEDALALDDTPAQIVTARLPRQRPEPPAYVTAAATPAVAAPLPEPTVVRLPETLEQDAVLETEEDLPGPYYDSYGEPRSETLTPEEYERLLEQRALAEDYVAERRAVAEDSIPPRRRALLRLLRR